MSQPELRVLESVDPRGSGLRVEFFRVGCRWAHRVLGVEKGDLVPLLESVEGDDSQSFPPSPALQQLVLEERDTGLIVALLVGMAGKNHWSVCAEQLPGTCGIRFDVACRNQPGGAGQLSSRYRALAPWRIAAGADAPSAEVGGNRYSLSAPCVRSPEAASRILLHEGQILLQPSVISDAGTQRWCYELGRTTPWP